MAFGSFNKKISAKPAVLLNPRKDLVLNPNINKPIFQPLSWFLKSWNRIGPIGWSVFLG